MNIRTLLAVPIVLSATVTQAQDRPVHRPESAELPVIAFDASAEDSTTLQYGELATSFSGAADDALPPQYPTTATANNSASLEAMVSGPPSQILQTQYSVPSDACCAANGCCTQSYGGDCGCGEGCCCDRDCYPLFSVGVEVPFLRPRISGAAPVFNVSPGAQRLIDPNYDPAIRYIAELRPEKSFGIRGRYFRYDHATGFDPPFQPAELGITVDSADLEFVFHHDTNRWNFDFSAGLEYGKLQYAADVATAVIGQGTATFEGLGPVFGLNAEHALGDTSFSFFGSVRASFLMGSIKNSALLINMPRAEIKDEMAQVYQNQLGVAWQPELSDRFGISVRAAWETQFWLNETFSDDSFGIGSNLSLTGPMVSAEISF